MIGIGVGTLCALIGLVMLGMQEQVGLVLLILGFVSTFSGMANQQDQKRLREAHLMQLTAPQPGDPNRAIQQAEDETRAAAALTAPSLPVLPASFPMQPGEFACYRGPATYAEERQLNRLAGGYMVVDAMPATLDEGELYVTTRRIVFSGSRQNREIPLGEIASLSVGPGALEVSRRGRPRPTLLGVPYPAELAAYIDRARAAAPVSLMAPYTPPAPAIAPPFGVTTSPIAATLNRHAPTTGSGVPAYITCARCGAANGLSANYCQNCAAPLTAGTTPTLQRPGPRD